MLIVVFFEKVKNLTPSRIRIFRAFLESKKNPAPRFWGIDTLNPTQPVYKTGSYDSIKLKTLSSTGASITCFTFDNN